MTTWRDLSDDELLARLRQRGVDVRAAKSYVRRRDDVDGAQVLDDLLPELSEAER